MNQRPPRPPATTLAPTSTPRVVGNVLGSAVVGGFEYFTKKWGPAAALEVITRLSPNARQYVTPHAPNIGLLGTKTYPYPVIGELVRTMNAVARVPEDDFYREISSAAVDASLNTIHRVAIRYLVSVQSLASRIQETWNLFHDCGRITVLSLTNNEYIVQMSDWPNHDVSVCRMSMEARRHLVERTGVKGAQLYRDKCQGWGNDVCISRIRW